MDMTRVGMFEPLDLVDLFLDFDAFKVVKLRLVALECRVHAVFGQFVRALRLQKIIEW